MKKTSVNSSAGGGIKAKAEKNSFAMSKGMSKRDAQSSMGMQNVSPDMSIEDAAVLKCASTNLMAGVSASRGKGQHN